MMHSRGYSLIELTASLCLSSVILIFLMRNMLSVQQQIHATLMQIKAIEERAFVWSFIQSRAHLAGFTPCRSLKQLTRIDTRSNPERLIDVELSMPFHLHFRHMSGHFSRVRWIENKNKLVLDRMDLNPNRPVLIANCHQAEVHEVDSISSEKEKSYLTLKEPIQYEYEGIFYVGEWISEAFLIKNHKLFYKQHHLDELSDVISMISADLVREGTHFVLKMKLNEERLWMTIRGRNG